jgi:uncharacterized protein (TIGR02996 family)
MTDRDALYQAILANPDEDTPRLVFADLVEENGDARYARFIRTQVELAKVPEWDPFWVRCWVHDRMAVTGAGFDRYLPRPPNGLGGGFLGFRRGFAWEVDVPDAVTFVSHARSVFALAPVQALRVNAAERTNLPTLANSPRLAPLRRLSIPLTRSTPEGIERFQNSPHAGGLTDLALALTPAAITLLPELLRAPLTDRLTDLRLSGDGLDWSAIAHALREAGPMPRLRSLKLSDRMPGSRPTGDLFAAPVFRELTHLDLGGLDLAPEALQDFAANPPPGLQSLDLSRVEFREQDVRAIAGAPGLAGLRRLMLARTGFGPTDLKALVGSPHVRNLRVLDLSGHWHLGDQEAKLLVESPHLGELLYLGLSGCGMGDRGAEAILESPLGARLIALDLLGSYSRSNISFPMRDRLKQRFGDKVRL